MNPIGMHYGFWSHNWDEIAYIPLMEKLARLGFDICEVASAEWGYYDDARLRELKACADMVDVLDAMYLAVKKWGMGKKSSVLIGILYGGAGAGLIWFIAGAVN